MVRLGWDYAESAGMSEVGLENGWGERARVVPKVGIGSVLGISNVRGISGFVESLEVRWIWTVPFWD